MATDRYLLVATPTASSPCFCVYFTLLQQVACDKKKKPHITPSPSTNTSYMNIIGIGMNRASPLLSGQAVVSWAETSHTRSNVISLLLDLLNSCWVRYDFYEVMIQKYSEWGHNLQLIIKISVLVFGEYKHEVCLSPRGQCTGTPVHRLSFPFALLLCASNFWSPLTTVWQM